MKRLLALLCSLALVFCLVPSTAFASGGNGNIDGGGGGMGQGTSSNFWNPGNDGVRITVVDAASGAAVSSPLDFSNRTQKSSILHFGKVNKLQYLSGSGLSLQSGVAYSCIKPAQSMPTIVSSKGQSNIDAIKRYFCSEYACMMVAQAAGVDYERMIAGEYKLLIEPIAYFTHNGQYYCMTATEAGLYDQMSGGNLNVVDPVGGTGGETGGTGTCQHKIRTVGQGSFHHNRGQIAVGQLQRERLRRSGGELLLKRGQNPHLHVVIQLIIGLSGIQNIASRTCIKNRGIALKYLTFQLLIDGGQENVDHSAVADHALPDSAVIGKKNRVIAQKI